MRKTVFWLMGVALAFGCIEDRRATAEEETADAAAKPDGSLDSAFDGPPARPDAGPIRDDSGRPPPPDAALADGAPRCEPKDQIIQARGEVRVLDGVPGLDVDVFGDLAFVTHRRGFEIIDVSDPANPIHASSAAVPGAHGLALTRDGAHGIVAALGDGVRVIDVRDAEAPREVGAFDLVGAAGAEYAHDLMVIGDRAYVAAGSQGFWIVDVSERRSPRPLGSCCVHRDRNPLDGARDIEVRGEVAWLIDTQDGLQVVDVSNPRRPDVVAGLGLDGVPLSLTLPPSIGDAGEGDAAYILLEEDQLAVVDIGAGEPPRLRLQLELPAQTVALALSGDQLFYGSVDGVFVANEQDPAPTELSFAPGRGATTALHVEGETLLVVSGEYLVIAGFDCPGE